MHRVMMLPYPLRVQLRVLANRMREGSKPPKAGSERSLSLPTMRYVPRSSKYTTPPFMYPAGCQLLVVPCRLNVRVPSEERGPHIVLMTVFSIRQHNNHLRCKVLLSITPHDNRHGIRTQAPAIADAPYPRSRSAPRRPLGAAGAVDGDQQLGLCFARVRGRAICHLPTGQDPRATGWAGGRCAHRRHAPS